MLELLRPFMPLLLGVGTLAAVAGVILTVRELRGRWKVIRADIAPCDWEREAQRDGGHDGRA